MNSAPMQYTRSHWSPARDPRHRDGGQFWCRFAFNV